MSILKDLGVPAFKAGGMPVIFKEQKYWKTGIMGRIRDDSHWDLIPIWLMAFGL